MKTAKIAGLLVGAAAALLLAAPQAGATGTRTVTFNASYTGKASLLIDNGNIKIISVSGSGTASVIGASTVAGTGSGVSDGSSACTPFKGTGKMKGTNGTIFVAARKTSSKACSSGQSGPVTVTITGIFIVKSGTGKAIGATGRLHYKGTLHLNDTSGSQTGKYTGTVSGKLTLPA